MRQQPTTIIELDADGVEVFRCSWEDWTPPDAGATEKEIAKEVQRLRALWLNVKWKYRR